MQEDQVVIVLRPPRTTTRREDLRQEKGRAIFRLEGIRVPKEALRVSKDGERGLCGGLPEGAVPAGENPGRGQNSYLVKADPTDEEDTRILRAGDEIVLASEELYDGKVVR
ncbi:MAG: hypothetical protein ACLS43_10915 [Evtepia gabavorous]